MRNIDGWTGHDVFQDREMENVTTVNDSSRTREKRG